MRGRVNRPAVISNSDYQSHEEIQLACSAYLRRRNHDARRSFEQRRAEKEAQAQTPGESAETRAGGVIVGGLFTRIR